MQTVYLFRGNALSEVDDDGRVRLPPFVRDILDRRGDERRIVVGVHERAPCLTGYDPAEGPALAAELERRRRREQAAGAGPDAHYARAHRLFGLAEEASYDGRGRIVLPPLVRRRGGIGDLALFVGVGASFEIWNPHLAREAGDEDLREVADYRLGASPGRHLSEGGKR